jgi:Uma2 family endonuclease
MSIVLPKPTISPAELLAMPDDGATYELVDGRLVEKNVSTLSCLVEGLLFGKVLAHCQQSNLGPVWTGTMGVQCFPGQPNKVRKPDLSFVKAERFTPELLDTGFLPIAPELAAEVISPRDLASEVYAKIEEYLQAGVSLVWVIDPETRVVQVYRSNGTFSRLRETDEMPGEDVLPGFRCRVGELFPVRVPHESA